MTEKRLERIEAAIAKLRSNDLPHLKAQLSRLDERTKGHGKLLAILVLAAITMGPAILVAVLVK